MLEALLCSMITILPDYLFRRYGQGKRIGREITLYSVWFELRWGIVACVVLTLALITMIFYFHPTTKNVTAAFRSVAVIPEISGRVDEVYVKPFQKVRAGDPLFRLQSDKQTAALESARKRVAEVDAQIEVAKSELVTAGAQIRRAETALLQAKSDLDTQHGLQKRSPGAVARQDTERLESLVHRQESELAAAVATKQTLEIRIATLLPAERSSAEARAAEAEVALGKTLVRAGIDGTLQQFTLRVGEVVNPLLRPAGILVPEDAGRERLVAGFGQIETQVLKVGMISEVTCIARPFKIIPMVVTDVQAVIASGQVRASDQLVDAQNLAVPGTVTAILEPLFPDQYGNIFPGSSCIANVYTSSHEELASEDTGALRKLFLHAVDATAIVHAAILRMQAVIAPVQTLVLTGH